MRLVLGTDPLDWARCPCTAAVVEALSQRPQIAAVSSAAARRHRTAADGAAAARHHHTAVVAVAAAAAVQCRPIIRPNY